MHKSAAKLESSNVRELADEVIYFRIMSFTLVYHLPRLVLFQFPAGLNFHLNLLILIFSLYCSLRPDSLYFHAKRHLNKVCCSFCYTHHSNFSIQLSFQLNVIYMIKNTFLFKVKENSWMFPSSRARLLSSFLFSNKLPMIFFYASLENLKCLFMFRKKGN